MNSCIKKRWYVYNKKADFQKIAAKFEIDQVTARILRNREVNSEGQIERFLNGTLEDMYSPLLLPDAIRCMNQLSSKIDQKKKIRVVGDYDIDGVCATYILYTGLKRAGAYVDYEIPDRIKDGYGINIHIIDAALEDDIDTVITCDNGISAIEELRYAKEQGITVLVTDHHDVRQISDEDCGCESRDLLPPAAAVVNPKRDGSRYPFSGICGAVVAWKMIQLLYEKRNMPKEAAMELLEFAAIATVGDVCILQDENRLIVKHGLSQMAESRNIGLRKLMEVTGLQPDALTAYHIGFVLGPCINAGGRLESAKLAMELFLCQDGPEAFEKALRLKELNDARKDMTKEACEQAFVQVEKEYADDRVLVIWLPELHESLAGIVAGRVRERFYRPAYVLTKAECGVDGTAMAKGSGRSIEGYPMSRALEEVSSLLTKFGGHPMAAGFSLPEANLDAFREALNRNCRLTEEQLCEKIWIDVPMPLEYVSEQLIQDLEKLEPFGNGNEKPQFATKDLKILQIQILGRNRNAVKLLLESPGGYRITGLLFTDGDTFLKERGSRNRMNVIYYPAVNEYNGTKSLQIMIRDYELFA